MQPNRVSPNSLSDITNVECESPRMKRMRIIKETKDKRKKGESSSAPSTNLDQNLDETTPNVDETTQNGKGNGNGFPCTAASRRKTNVHKEPYMQESRHDNHKEAPSKDHASSSRSHNSLYNSEEYDDNGDAIYNCEHCGALMWYNERIEKRRVKSYPKFSLCCMHGKIDLAPPPELPQILKDLMFKGDERSKNFMENIRPYNSMFAFTSMGGTINTSVNKGRGPNVYRRQGQSCHRIGSLLPPLGKPPKFNQLYIQDTENENQNRIEAFSAKRTGQLPESKTLRDDIVEDIKKMLNEYNPYSKILRTAKDRFKDTPSSNVQLKLISRRTAGATSSISEKTYNLPTTTEVAALYAGEFDIEMEPRDVVLETRDGNLKRISELHAGYLPLQYPFLFPYGEDGYHIDFHVHMYYYCFSDFLPNSFAEIETASR